VYDFACVLRADHTPKRHDDVMHGKSIWLVGEVSSDALVSEDKPGNALLVLIRLYELNSFG